MQEKDPTLNSVMKETVDTTAPSHVKLFFPSTQLMTELSASVDNVQKKSRLHSSMYNVMQFKF